MDDRDVVTPEALWQAVEADLRAMVAGVAGTVSAAPRGQWIPASEEQVRDLLARVRERVYQAALQLKVDAAEGAFSPSGARPVQRPQPREPGHGQRLGAPGADPLAGSGRAFLPAR